MIWVPPRQDIVRCTRVGRWSSSGAGPGVRAPWVGVRVSEMVRASVPSIVDIATTCLASSRALVVPIEAKNRWSLTYPWLNVRDNR